MVAGEIKPIDDIRSTAEYRVAISREMLYDALSLAWERTYPEKSSILKMEVNRTLKKTLIKFTVNGREKPGYNRMIC